MAIPNNTDWAWSQYTTAHSSPYADFSDSTSGLLGRHEGEYGAPPTYFPHPQGTSYHHFDIGNGPTHHSTEHRSYPRGQSRPPKTTYGAMKSPFRQSLFHVFCAVLATVVFAVTSWFAQATFSANSTAEATNILNAIHVSFGSTIAMLRFLQGLTSTCTIIVLNQAFERVQWSLASSKYGIRLLSLLSLSPATSLYGIVGIAFGRRASISDRVWALLRLIFSLSVWVSGILLFVNTSTLTVYDSIETFPVTAGTGQFNASLVDPFMAEARGSVPYGALASAFDLVGNPQLAIEVPPINCTTDQCESYLFPGGLGTTTPWPPTDHPDSPVVQINSSPASQIEFQEGIAEGDGFFASDCAVYGSEEYPVGVSFCLAQSQVLLGSYIAAIYVCTNGTSNGQCLTSGMAPNISTTFTVYSRQATTICARSNNSILTVSDLTSPAQNTNIDVAAFNTAMGWLLDYTSAKLPPASSIAYLFWSSQMQLSNNFWSTNVYTSLKSLIAFVLWLFNVNNYGNPIMRESPHQEITYLPPEYSTNASICNPYVKVVVDPRMFVAYLTLQLVVLVFVWASLIIICLSRSMLPDISSYRLIDFAAKAVEKNVLDRRTGLDEKLESMTNGGDHRVRKELRDVRVFLRSNDGEQGKATAVSVAEPDGYSGVVKRLVLVTDSGDGLEMLKERTRYR